MADLTAAAPLRFRDDGELYEERWICDSSAASTFYRGQPVIIDVGTDTTYVRPWTSSITLITATDVFVGIALEDKAIAAGDAENTSNAITVAGPGSIVGFKSAVFTDADVGKDVGFSDSGTLVAVTIAGAADKCPMGRLIRVENGYAYVKLQNYPVIMAF